MLCGVVVRYLGITEALDKLAASIVRIDQRLYVMGGGALICMMLSVPHTI
jgi:hypothetical protein